MLLSRETAYVAGFKPQGEKFEPVVEPARSGIVFNVRAQVSDDRRHVTLTLNPRLSTLLDLLPQRWPDAPPGRDDLLVQQPLLQEIALDATVTVPAGRTAAFRLYPVKVPTTNPREPRSDPVLMLVTATVVDAREQPATPAAPATRAGVPATRPAARLIVEPVPPQQASDPVRRLLDSRQ